MSVCLFVVYQPACMYFITYNNLCSTTSWITLKIILGLFYFLKPYGESTGSVNVEISPKNSILKPHEQKQVDVKITGNDVGIFENIYIPCFINKNQYIIVRVLCAVDTVHLAMYLPGKNNYYQKIMWPPKILFEYDDNPMICSCPLVNFLNIRNLN